MSAHPCHHASTVQHMEHTCQGEWRTSPTRSDASNSCIQVCYCSTGKSSVLTASERRGREGKSAASHRAGAEMQMHRNRPFHATTCAAARACAAATFSGQHAIAATAPSSTSQTLPPHSDPAWPILTPCPALKREGEDGEARMARRVEGGEARTARRGRRGEDGGARGPSRQGTPAPASGAGTAGCSLFRSIVGECQPVQQGPNVLFRTETAERTNAVPFLSND